MHPSVQKALLAALKIQNILIYYFTDFIRTYPYYGLVFCTYPYYFTTLYVHVEEVKLYADMRPHIHTHRELRRER